MNRILILMSLIAVSWTSAAQYDPEARKILDAMSAKYKNAPAFSASFTQNLKNPTAGLDESIDGKITVKNDKYLLEVSGSFVYNNGVDVFTYNPEINEVTIAPFDDGGDEISLNNVYDIYKTGFKYGVQEVVSGVTHVDLEPEDRSGKSYFKIRMEIDGQNNLTAFSVFEPSGNVYRYSVSNFKEIRDLSDDAFVFDIRKHTDDPKVIENLETVDFR